MIIWFILYDDEVSKPIYLIDFNKSQRHRESFGAVLLSMYFTICNVQKVLCNNPLTSVAISKLLEVIGISAYFPRRLDRDRSPLGHKPDYRHGWLSEYVRKSMHACHSVSAACRPAETAGQRGEIGSVRRSIRVGRKRPVQRQRVNQSHSWKFWRPCKIWHPRWPPMSPMPGDSTVHNQFYNMCYV